MNAKQLDEVVHKTQELIKTPTCCQELKEMAEKWLKSIGSENEALTTIYGRIKRRYHAY